MKNQSAAPRATLALSLVLSAWSFSGCGEEEVSIENLAPGEECISGGVQITRDGKVSIECIGDPDIAVEYFAANEGGNPCFGSAMLTSDRTSGELVETWTCRTVSVEELSPFFQDLHAYARAYIQFPMLQSLTLVKSCQTGSEIERHALAIYEFAYAAMGQISPCIAEQLLTFKEPSAAVKLQIECSIFDSKVQLDCFENVGTLDPNDEEVDCSEQLEEQISACREEGLEDAPATCLEAGSLDEDAEIELSEFHNAFMEMVDTCAVRLF